MHILFHMTNVSIFCTGLFALWLDMILIKQISMEAMCALDEVIVLNVCGAVSGIVLQQ